MIYDQAIANGREHMSADWLREMLAMEMESYDGSDYLPVPALVSLTLVSAGAEKEVATALPRADAAGLLAGSDAAAVLAAR